MKQIFQNLKTGELTVDDVPIPAVRPKMVLMRNAYSVVSAGTEKMVVDMAKKSIVGKARERPDLVKKVIQKVKTDGLRQTYRTVKGRLDAPSPLGYSCAGTCVEVGEGVEEFHVGERLACGGAKYASHAEFVTVPKNLCVKIPDNVELDEAAFATIGAIALQGVRLAELELGDRVVVIGLGLVGQLVAQLVKASGCSVFGVDLEPQKVDLALRLGMDDGAISGSDDVVGKAMGFTNGMGADAVIIAAATKSNNPIQLAGEIARLKGRISVIGAVGMNIPRDLYYKKELEVVVSMSYGPGRYDADYEERGVDYPYAYVRWTEQRNMEAFLELLSQGKVKVKELVTHRFKIDDAKNAYALLSGETEEKYLGILLEYPEIEAAPPTLYASVERKLILREKQSSPAQREVVNLGIIGVGNYAKGVLLPRLEKIENVNIHAIAAATGLSARHTAERYEGTYCTTDYREILDDEQIHAVIIATRHNLHVPIAVEALRKGKDVFTEKPLAISAEQLEEVVQAYQESERNLMVGFNRRFSPLARQGKRFFSARRESAAAQRASAAGRTNPLVIDYRVNAGFIPLDHWIQDKNEGGGRIIGEVCHFIDLMQFFTDAEPIKVYAETVSNTSNQVIERDNLFITIKFSDGSIGSINYNACGDTSFSKERVEIFGDNRILVIDDFRTALCISHGKTKRIKMKTDKGQSDELKIFVDAVRGAQNDIPPFKDAVLTTKTTFAILESIRSGQPVEINEDVER